MKIVTGLMPKAGCSRQEIRLRQEYIGTSKWVPRSQFAKPIRCRKECGSSTSRASSDSFLRQRRLAFRQSVSPNLQQRSSLKAHCVAQRKRRSMRPNPVRNEANRPETPPSQGGSKNTRCTMCGLRMAQPAPELIRGRYLPKSSLGSARTRQRLWQKQPV